MKVIALLLAAVCFSAVAVQADDWAVIVAGSNSYSNYRHQADACHAYQIMRNNGIPDSNIIVMQYDDIANSYQNPFPGQVFNKPSSGPGVDVYANCKKDYTGRDVTPENFIAVLTGDVATAKGPVLKSTGNDNVFINFADHGGPGLIAFPSTTLSATTLNAALVTMHENNMYAELTFYLEACESGSMFEGLLPTDLNIYAVTAADATESSWGTYCPPQDQVNGKNMNTCLGDLFSVSWMENTESVGTSQSLQTQYDSVQQLTNKSHTQQFGDLSFTASPISDFMGTGKTRLGQTLARDTAASDADVRMHSAVRSRDIPLHLAHYKVLRSERSDFAGRMQLSRELQTILESRIKADTIFMNLARTLGGSDDTTDRLFNAAHKGAIIGDTASCYEKLVATYESACTRFDDYSLQHARVLLNMCEHTLLTSNYNAEGATNYLVSMVNEQCEQ